MTGNSTFEYYNANRDGKNVGDCTVRAISVALDQDWDTTYWGLCWEGYLPQICRQEIRFGANISAVKAGGAICRSTRI